MAKNVLTQHLQMDTQTVFQPNGNIDIYPYPFENENEPLTRERSVSYTGRITVMEDGNTCIRPYNIGSNGPQYRKLYNTEHCTILITQNGNIIERWKFDHRLSIHEVGRIRKRENPMINAFYTTLK